MPQTRATKNAYACSQPRIRGLPRSTGFIRNGVWVSSRHRGYGTVGYSSGSEARRSLGWQDDSHEGTARWVARRCCSSAPTVNRSRRGAPSCGAAAPPVNCAAVEIVPGARTVLLDGVDDPAARPSCSESGRRRRRRGVADATAGHGSRPCSTARTCPTSPSAGASSVPTAVDRLAGGRAAGGVLRLRARVRVHARAARGVGGAPAGRRRAPRVPAGSVALAGAVRRHLSDAPRRAAGGWSAAPTAELFDVRRDPPALLAPGTRVRLAARMIRWCAPAPLTTVQDLGRPGYAHLGVPRSGALDQPALRLANALVGNPDGRRRPGDDADRLRGAVRRRPARSR